MKKYIILLAVIFISIITKAQNAKFYILNVAAVSTNNEAELKSKELIRKDIVQVFYGFQITHH